MNTTEHPVLLFDGVCNLCNGSVQFIIERDPDARFRFASLQSEEGQAVLSRFENRPSDLSSVVLIQDDQLYARSEAALRVARQLEGGWSLLYAFIVVPRPIRDAVYDWIARNRYRWFGKKDACMIPSPDLQSRFL
ncbi:thiol-disulfide oxidoreductase DCC family protein [Phaeodactylibacter xiamenensis]|uniref:thiol-disulfide oxidoreductase DCC family protein n=1 Tax=Phaeodactylibacter xiamenensis TaxID=1524460 RepID=UPI003CCBCEC2